MKKIRIAVVIMLFAVLLASCTNQNQPPVLITGQQQVIRNVDELKAKLGSASSGSYKIDVAVSTSDIPITINGNKDIKGSISVIDGATSSSSLKVAQAGKNIFEIADGASVSISGLTATIPADAAAEVASVVYVNTGKLDARSITVVTDSTSTETTVSAVAVSAATKSENLNVGNINGSVYIPSGNTDEDLRDKVEESVGEIVSDSDAGQDGFLEMLATLKTASLTEDVTVKELGLQGGTADAVTEYTIFLNGHTLAVNTDSGMSVPSYCTLNVYGDGTDGSVFNTTLNQESSNIEPGYWMVTANIGLSEKSTLKLSDLTYTGNAAGITLGSNDEAQHAKEATVGIDNCVIRTYGAYAVGTNASGNPPYTTDITVDIVDSIIEANYEGGDSDAILMNIPGTMTITGSTITGGRQGIIVRGGDVSITDSTINSRGNYNGGKFHLDANWGSGNEVPFAALVIGNRSSAGAYDYAASCTLNRVSISNANTSDNAFEIYISSCNDNTATLISSQYASMFGTNPRYEAIGDAGTTIIKDSAEGSNLYEGN